MKDEEVHNLLEKQKVLQDQLEKVKGQVPEIKEENLMLSNEKVRSKNIVSQINCSQFPLKVLPNF